MEEVALLPGRQLSALQSSQHLLPAAQPHSSGTSLPFAPSPAQIVLLESKWESLGLALVSSFHSDWARVLLCNLLYCR